MNGWKEGSKAICGTVLALATVAGAARLPERIVDAGLHRQWLIERDPSHPERPARLVEVPWSSGAAATLSAVPVASRKLPGVRAGMKVTLWRRDRNVELQLTGTALRAASVGTMVEVRAGLHGSVLRGIVRGKAVVELEPGRP